MPMEMKDRGTTLIETMIAIIVAFITMASIGYAVFRASLTNKNQGTEQTRMTVLAQEKMEELTRLDYADTTTNTTLITDTGWAKGLTSGGGTNMITSSSDCSSTAFQGYVDLLDLNSQPINASCATALASPYGYIRRWQITDVGTIPSVQLLAFGDGSTKAFSGTLVGAPIQPNTVTITASVGSVPIVATDDGSGDLNGVGINMGAVNYSTGAIMIRYNQPPDANSPINATITVGATYGLKQVTVVVYSLVAVRGGQAIPKVVLTSLKSQ